MSEPFPAYIGDAPSNEMKKRAREYAFTEIIPCGTSPATTYEAKAVAVVERSYLAGAKAATEIMQRHCYCRWCASELGNKEADQEEST